MKKIIAVCLLLVSVLSLASCGKKYTCVECDKQVGTIYVDIDGDPSYCKDCAREYWMPLDYTQFKY